MGDIRLEASDAGKRASAEISIHIAAGMVGHWAAIRLSDGGSDGVAYATKQDAIRHQFHENLCAYACIPADGMPPHDADGWLAAHRKLYDAGLRPTDPRTPIVPITRRLTL